MKKIDFARRRFLRDGVAASAGAWAAPLALTATAATPAPNAEYLEVGLPKSSLLTPALCVDLDKLEGNIDTMQNTVSRNGIGVRPHTKTHKCPAIAHLQMERGAVGICTAKLTEAEVMFEHGLRQILLTTVNVSAAKIRRAMQLRKQCDGFIQAVDTERNARELNDAAREAGIIADVTVDVDPGGHRSGITPGEPALTLAQLVDRLNNLRLRGILCYDGGSQHVSGFAARRTQAIERLAPAAETFSRMQQSGLNVEIFSGGGTGTYNIDHATPGFTDIQSGSYVFMDASYLGIGGQDNDEVYGDFKPSLTILTTVLNAQYEGRATTDAGAKSCTINRPWSIVVGETGMSYTSGSDEYGTIRYENPSRVYQAGDRLELIISHCDPVVNLYDKMYAIRNNRVEAVWRIAGRGKNQ
ncbi:MAG: DSD1 family PLP-dependent enzyme [Vicinamibacterales bacterium]|nr:DSD1 family PLP-dependent enzyme [Vicinamibacterales bacterium]